MYALWCNGEGYGLQREEARTTIAAMKLNAAFLRLKISVPDFAALVPTDRSSASLWVNDHRLVPWRLRERVAELLGLTPDQVRKNPKQRPRARHRPSGGKGNGA